jgi:hypothetical protein
MGIEERLLARNIAHFGQAQGALFTTTRMQQLFGYSRSTQQVEELRKNLLNKETLPPTILSNKNSLPPIPTNIIQEEFEKAFKKWSEGTSTSPSGRHLGHYKCLFAVDGYTYTNNNPDPSEEIMGV